MTAAAGKPTIRQRVELVPGLQAGHGMSLDRICELIPEFDRQQVRGAIKNLMNRGLVIRYGTIRHPAYQLVQKPKKPSTESAVARVIHPTDVKLIFRELPKQPPFAGTDWSRSMSRPGCQDHELVPSRRGDVRVAHRGPMGICGARKRRESA